MKQKHEDAAARIDHFNLNFARFLKMCLCFMIFPILRSLFLAHELHMNCLCHTQSRILKKRGHSWRL